MGAKGGGLSSSVVIYACYILGAAFRVRRGLL